MKNTGKIVTLLLLFCLIHVQLRAQMKRERVKTVEAVETFNTPGLMAQSTTRQLAPANLNVTIMHSFGIATRNVVQNFFGFDNVQNVRLGLDVGLTEHWSLGIGRSSRFNVVDLRTKVALLQQKSDDSMPLNLSLKGNIGVVTQLNNRPFRDDISSHLSAIISRKMNKTISLQLSPMYSHFQMVRPGEVNNLFSVGIGSQINLSERYSLITEYYPVFGERNQGTNNAFTLGLNIETGGHVFQLFFSSTQWHLDQYVLARNDQQFWNGDFRFGFNVNRIFGL